MQPNTAVLPDGEGALEVDLLDVLHHLLQGLGRVKVHQVVLLDDGGQLLLDGLCWRPPSVASLHQLAGHARPGCEERGLVCAQRSPSSQSGGLAACGA